MSDLWSNEYGAPAGKGAKERQRRERLTLETIPKKIAKAKQRPYLTNPTNEKRRAKKIEMSESYHTAIGVKARIRLLVVDHDMGYLDMCATMKREGCPVSNLTLSNVRSEMKEVMRLLETEGLLNTEALAKRRRQLKGKGV